MKQRLFSVMTLLTAGVLFTVTGCSSDLDKAKDSAKKTLECLEIIISDEAAQDAKIECKKHNRAQKELEDKLSPEDKEKLAVFYVEQFKIMQEERDIDVE